MYEFSHFFCGHVLFCSLFASEGKFCGVPSLAIVKVGCAVDKKGCGTLL